MYQGTSPLLLKGMTMTPKTKRIAATGTSLALVGGIVLGSWAIATSASADPASVPTPTPTATTVSVPYTSPDTLEAKRAAEAEAARIEAERVAAEQAAAVAAQAEADRIAAEQAAEAQRQAEQGSAPQAPVAPAAPAPAPAPVNPGPGDQQAGECREYNDANECTAWYVP